MEVFVSVVSADPAMLLETISSTGIDLRNAVSQDGLEVRFGISDRDLEIVKRIVDRRGDSLSVLDRKGFGFFLRSIAQRWVLLVVCVTVLLLSLWIPQRVLFVLVEGNERVSDQEILLASEECGLFFGAERSGVRSVQIKNYLLERLPSLGWACVNTLGCVATITVVEKTESAPMNESASESIDIVSAIDGVIIEQQIHSGFSQIQVGQAVKAGQILVSGSQMDGIIQRNIRPNAEIYAITNRECSVNKQSIMFEKNYTEESACRFSIIFLKNEINLLKDSRICTTECDKMYEEFYITLPGGFRLPFGIRVETVRPYDLVVVDAADLATQQAYAALERYLYDQMISGSIVSCNTVRQSDERITVCYQCTEMIGRECERKNEAAYGEND